MGILSLYLKYYLHIVSLVHTLHLVLLWPKKREGERSQAFIHGNLRVPRNIKKILSTIMGGHVGASLHPSFITIHSIWGQHHHQSPQPSIHLPVKLLGNLHGKRCEFLQHASKWMDLTLTQAKKTSGKKKLQTPIPIFWWYSNCNCWFFKMMLEIDMFFCHVGEIISGASVSCRLLCKSGIDWFFARGGVRCRTPRTSCARMAWELHEFSSTNARPNMNFLEVPIES